MGRTKNRGAARRPDSMPNTSSDSPTPADKKRVSRANRRSRPPPVGRPIASGTQKPAAASLTNSTRPLVTAKTIQSSGRKR